MANKIKFGDDIVEEEVKAANLLNVKPIPIAIDLGTTTACISYWDEKTQTHKIIPNSEGGNTTPMVVAFTQPKDDEPAEGFKSETLVGVAAFK